MDTLAAEQIMRPDKDMVEPLWSPVGDAMSPGLNEGKSSDIPRQAANYLAAEERIASLR